MVLAEEQWEWFERLMQAPGWAYTGAVSLLLFYIEIFGVVDVSIPFVYYTLGNWSQKRN
jgi:hypothetical protein